MEIFLKKLLKQSAIVAGVFALLLGLVYTTDFLTSFGVSSNGNDPVFNREIVAYELKGDGTVAYEYVAELLPEKLAPAEAVEKRTESSFTKYLGTNAAGEEVYELTAYSGKAFVERGGKWFARETGHTAYENFAAVRRGNPIASLFWERAYADSISPFAAAGDGTTGFSSISSTWTATRSAATGDTNVPTGANMTVRAQRSSGVVRTIERSFIPFDTSAISASATVAAATFNVYVSAITNTEDDGDDFITLVRSSQATHTTFTTADYDQFGSTEGIDSGERKDISSVTTSAYLVFTLNSTGRAWIAKSGVASNCSASAGITCLALREGHDFIDSDMTDGTQNYVTMSASETTGTAEDPYLSVTYLLPVAPRTLSKPPNNLGLVGYWSFNEGTSTQATDFSGRGNHGILDQFSSPPTANSGWTPKGARGGALQFDAVDDYLSVGDLNNLTDGVQNLTISVWVKENTLGDFNSIVGKANGVDGWAFQTGGGASGGNNDFIFYPSLSDANAVYTTSNSHQSGVWEHWVVTFDGTIVNDLDSVDFYKNGVEITSESQTAAIPNITDSNGSSVSVADFFYSGAGGGLDGAIDEVRIYNRTLSASEIAALYGVGGGATRVSNSSKTIQKGTTLGSGLGGYWTFDGGDTRWNSPTAGVTYDGSGNGSNASTVNMSRAAAPIIGKLGQGFSFDGVDDYITAVDANNLDVGDVLTLAFWFKRASLNNNACVETLLGKGDVGGYGVDIVNTGCGTDGIMQLCFNSVGCPLESSVAITDTAWHHFVATKNGTSRAMYIDGADVTVLLTNVTGLNTTGALNIGNDSFGGGSPGVGLYYKGALDDFRIYNRALTSIEAKQLYRLGLTRIRQ